VYGNIFKEERKSIWRLEAESWNISLLNLIQLDQLFQGEALDPLRRTTMNSKLPSEIIIING
jgi:hypothetical protein